MLVVKVKLCKLRLGSRSKHCSLVRVMAQWTELRSHVRRMRRVGARMQNLRLGVAIDAWIATVVRWRADRLAEEHATSLAHFHVQTDAEKILEDEG